jgi:hypothetical protein
MATENACLRKLSHSKLLTRRIRSSASIKPAPTQRPRRCLGVLPMLHLARWHRANASASVSGAATGRRGRDEANCAGTLQGIVVNQVCRRVGRCRVGIPTGDFFGRFRYVPLSISLPLRGWSPFQLFSFWYAHENYYPGTLSEGCYSLFQHRPRFAYPTIRIHWSYIGQQG